MPRRAIKAKADDGCAVCQAAWIDKPALAAPEILDALAQAGLRYLPPLLDRGASAPERLKTPRASALVRITPDYSPADGSTRRYEKLLQSRWRAIAVQCEAKRVRPPAVPKLRMVNGLTLSIGLGETPVTQISASNFLEGDVWLIDLTNVTDGLASALAEGVGHGADLRYRFAAILRARNRDEVIRALLEDGIPPYQLAAVRLEDDPELDEEEWEFLVPTPARARCRWRGLAGSARRSHCTLWHDD